MPAWCLPSTYSPPQHLTFTDLLLSIDGDAFETDLLFGCCLRFVRPRPHFVLRCRCQRSRLLGRSHEAQIIPPRQLSSCMSKHWYKHQNRFHREGPEVQFRGTLTTSFEGGRLAAGGRPVETFLI